MMGGRNFDFVVVVGGGGGGGDVLFDVCGIRANKLGRCISSLCRGRKGYGCALMLVAWMEMSGHTTPLNHGKLEQADVSTG